MYRSNEPGFVVLPQPTCDRTRRLAHYVPSQRSSHTGETLRAIVDVDTGEIEVSVEDGIVTLSGPVSEHAVRRIVIEEVEKIDGVERVIDEIVVAVPSEASKIEDPAK